MRAWHKPIELITGLVVAVHQKKTVICRDVSSATTLAGVVKYSRYLARQLPGRPGKAFVEMKPPHTGEGRGQSTLPIPPCDALSQFAVIDMWASKGGCEIHLSDSTVHSMYIVHVCKPGGDRYRYL
jgi:hypothetical protein